MCATAYILLLVSSSVIIFPLKNQVIPGTGLPCALQLNSKYLGAITDCVLVSAFTLGGAEMIVSVSL